MNQILDNRTLKYNAPSDSISTYSKKFKWIFRFSLFVIILCLIFFIFSGYHTWQKEKLSKSLVNQFEIRNLYANSNDYQAQKMITTAEEENPFVIGLLKIDKINLMYPILSTTSEELLKISPCRFYGPMPNEVRKSLHCWT